MVQEIIIHNQQTTYFTLCFGDRPRGRWRIWGTVVPGRRGEPAPVHDQAFCSEPVTHKFT